jgi:PTS system mannose-specific IIA component
MNVGLLLITHNDLGRYLLDTASGILGSCPVRTRCLNVPASCDPDKVFESACALYRELDQGDGVLVLTDLYGSTPSNIAARLLEKYNILVISGVNVPMLMRILNYPTCSLEEMANKALTGARDGVVINARKLAS